MGLPREGGGGGAINRKISKLNVLLQDKLGDMGNVSLCDNSNLFYLGQQARGALGKDGKYLSRLGTTKLGANLKSAIYKTLGESSGQAGNKPNGYYGNRNGGQFGYRPRNGYWRGGYY